MNIFVLDYDPIKAAQMHCDKHVVKMVLESCQLLCSVHHMISDRIDIPYRISHKNHPCSIWARESYSNYIWLLDLTRALLDEYTYRYGKKHASERVYDWCVINLPNIEDKGLTKFALAMPDDCKQNDVVESYKTYYLRNKINICTYKRREKPEFIKNNI